jgi:hypothetical protein
LLAQVEPIARSDYSDIIWNKAASLKVSPLAWCLLRNRIPTKNNLVNKVSFSLLKLCVGGCGMEENVDHLFLGCDFFRSI